MEDPSKPENEQTNRVRKLSLTVSGFGVTSREHLEEY